MDFIVCGNFSPATMAVGTLIFNRSLEDTKNIIHSTVGNIDIFSTSTPARYRDAVYLFDGTALHLSRFINCHDPIVPKYLSDLKNCAELSVSGTYCIGSVADDGSFSFEVDELAAYHLWYYSFGDRFAISNNIYFIESLLRSEGIEITRTIECFIAKLYWDAPHRLGSATREAKLIAPRQRLFGKNVLNVVRSHNLKQFYFPGNSYRDAVMQACSQIDHNIQAIVGNSKADDIYYDVTGGKDSRIVFASLKKNGFHQALSYRTIRKYPHPDGNYAALLAEKYCLTPFDFPLLSGELPHALDSNLPSYDVFAAMGLAVGDGSFQNMTDGRQVHIHGGFGELGGSSPDSKRCLGFKQGMSARQLAAVYAGKLGYLPFLTKEASSHFLTLTADWFRQIVDETGRVSAIPIVFYNEGKARSHFGFISKFRGKKKRYPDVLHTRWLSIAAAWLETAEMVGGKVSFDVIRDLDGLDLLGLPLADTSWPRSFIPDDLVDLIPEAMPITAATAPLYNAVQWGKNAGNSIRVGTTAASRKVPPQHRSTFIRQNIVKQYLSDTSSLFDFIDKDTLIELTNRDPAAIGQRESHILNTSAHALLWAAGAEKPFILSGASD